jgi:hypothetical protein
VATLLSLVVTVLLLSRGVLRGTRLTAIAAVTSLVLTWGFAQRQGPRRGRLPVCEVEPVEQSERRPDEENRHRGDRDIKDMRAREPSRKAGLPKSSAP